MPASDASAPKRTADGVSDDGGSDAASDPPTLTRSDERILAYLDDVGTDYPAFVAGNTGLYADHVDERLNALAAGGLVEAVTGESVYRLTDAGREALREDCAAWSD